MSQLTHRYAIMPLHTDDFATAADLTQQHPLKAYDAIHLAMALPSRGVDASEEMLAICRTKSAHVGVTPTLYQQLMQDLDLASRYHTMFIPACLLWSRKNGH